MNLSSEVAVYSLLLSVLVDGGYSSVELNKVLNGVKVDERPYITRLFYGVLDKSVQFDYIISKLASKKPKSAVVILIKMGLYLLRYSDTPDYASVSKIVELAKEVGKKGTEGFINAVLKKSSSVELSDSTDRVTLSINASCPEWIVGKFIKDYGFEFTRDYLMHKENTLTHIRANTSNITIAEFEKKYDIKSVNNVNIGYYVTHNTIKTLNNADFVVQSRSSILAVDYYSKDESPKKILDLCASPGGKSVLLKQTFPDASVVSCDIHAHRVELIKKYASNVGVDLNVVSNDATVLNKEWIDGFDMVVVDVPCSGIGVKGKKPEVMFNRRPEDIPALAKLQLDILTIASNYVCKGGVLCYSTCTTLKQENEKVVNVFMENNKEYAIDKPYLSLFPHIDNCDGFFVARLRKL